MLNRRGTAIAWGILFLGVLAIIGGALFVFASYRDNVKTNSMENSALIEKYLFEIEYVESIFELSVMNAANNMQEQSFEESFRQEIERRNPGDDSHGNLFAKVKRGEYQIIVSSTGYTVIVPEVYVKAENGDSSMKRTWDLETSIELV